MDRFVSTYTMRLDAKGRVSVPAPYRTVIAKDGLDIVYCHPSLDAPSLDAGGQALLSEIDRLIATLPPYSEERDELATALYGTTESLKLDQDGRVQLTDSLKSHAGIADAAIFVGHGHKFQIWEPDRFRAHLDEAKAKVREMRKRFGSQDAGPRAPGARE